MEINTDFWAGKRVLITGHTGFKGSWLSLWLTSMGARVSGLSLSPETTPNLFDTLSLSKSLDDNRGDIRDIQLCNRVVVEKSPEILIHMAAQPLVRRSYKDPVYTYETNVMGTVNVLQAARECESIKSILVVTTDKCYENLEKDHAYIEVDSLGGHDPYSSSKACEEHVSSAYYRSYYKEINIGLATARAGNVIGGGDWSEDRLIPDIIKAFNSDNMLKIRNPHAIRPWQHVLEPLSGYLLLIEKLWENPTGYSGAWNFGPNHESVQTVGKMVETAAELWNNSPRWEILANQDFHEATLLKLNSDKATTNLSWHPKMNFKNALEMTMEWYNQFFLGNDDMVFFTLNQIKEYSAKNG